jgi:hypothetical protein
MNLINTHKYSCLLDSFAFILEKRPMFLIQRLGHSGWENGFHTQELIEVLLDLGWAVTLIERKPIALNPVTGTVREIHFGDRSADNRFIDRIWDSTGVLTGENSKKVPHAVAWQCNRIWDSANGACYSHIEADCGAGDCPKPRFTAWNFLQMDRIL